MHQIYKLIFLIFSTITWVSVNAETSQLPAHNIAETKNGVAVIDSRLAMLNTQKAKNDVAKLHREIEPDKQKLEDIKAAITKLEQNFRKDADRLSEHERHEMQHTAEHRLEEYTELSRQVQTKIETTQNGLIEQLSGSMAKIVAQIQDEQGIGVVLEKKGVYAALPGKDITDLVTKRLNRLHQSK